MKKLSIGPEDIGKPSVRLWTDNVDREQVARELNTDNYTIDIILDGLVTPMRDLRYDYQQPILKSDILTREDLQVGMELEGTVRNVTDLGALVDVGLKNVFFSNRRRHTR